MAIRVEEIHTPMSAERIAGLHVSQVFRVVSERRSFRPQPIHDRSKSRFVNAKSDVLGRRRVGARKEKRHVFSYGETVHLTVRPFGPGRPQPQNLGQESSRRLSVAGCNSDMV